jgi:hypothetical protein
VPISQAAVLRQAGRRAATALEEGSTHLAFQRTDVIGYRNLGDPQALGTGAETPDVDGFDKHLQLSEGYAQHGGRAPLI